MSETRAQYGEAEPLLSGALRIAAGTVSFAPRADLRRILLEAADENERLRAALRGMVEYRERWDMEEGHHDWCNALDGDDCTCGMDAARAALNHAAPAAEQEGE